MKLSKFTAFILALLLALIIGLLLFVKEGGCDRDDVPDEDPEPACKAGDKTCKVDEPAPPPAPPPIGAKP